MRILHSTSRSALREKCLREVCELTTVWPDQRAILLVPEQTKMDMERDYLAISGQSGLMMAEVLSFRRLAWRLLSEVGQQPGLQMDKIGQAMLIHRILKQNQSELHSFGHLADQPGFISQVSAVLGDLKRYQVDARQLLMAEEKASDKALKNKAHDLGILLEEYDQVLHESELCDAEDDLNRLGEVLQSLCQMTGKAWPWPLKRLEWLRRTSIWVNGFGELRDFTPQEDRILKSLALLAGQLTVTIAADQVPFDRLAVDSGSDYFLPGRKTAWRLQHALPVDKIERVPDQLTGYPGLVAASLREGRPCPPESALGQNERRQSFVQLIRANGRDAELAFAAGEIRRLVQLEGYRYQDITLAVCDLPGYTPRLKATCREYGIPLFLDARRPLSGTPLLRFVLGLLDIGLKNWTLASVMSCLRSGLTPVGVPDADRLENELLARGVCRPDRLFDDSRYTQEDLLAIRDQALSPIRAILSDLKKASSGSQKCLLLRQFFQDYGLDGRIEQRSAGLIAEGEMDMAVALVQAWNELEHIFDQMIQLNGETAMPLQTFRDTLAAAMDAAGSIVIPSAIDQVNVGDLKRAMLRQPRVLFLIGATAALLPPALPPEGLLKDQDRQSLSGLLNCQLPSSARDQSFADAFVLYTLLTLPTDRLYLTAPDNNVSLWFKWLDQPEKSAVRILPDNPGWADARLNAVRPAFGHLLRFCNQQSKEKEAQQAMAGWRIVAQVLANANMPLTPAVLWLKQASEASSQQDSRLKPGLVRDLYSTPITMSVSQLEKYASCPFLHLSSYLLALQQRPVWAPEAAKTGTLLHGIVELALRELRQDLDRINPDDQASAKAIFEEWSRSDLDSRTLAWMETAARRDMLEMFFDNGLKASAGFRVQRLASASLQAILRQYLNEAYWPSDLEWCFGPKEKTGLPLKLPDGTVIAFHGKVDRVDLAACPEDHRFRIVDYKSGDKKADYDALYHGLALQLPLYLEAFCRARPGSMASDAAYFQFDRPMLKFESGAERSPEQLQAALSREYALRGLGLTPDQLVFLRRHTLSRAGSLVKSLLAGDFAVAPRKLPGKDPACKNCLMRSVCGFDGRSEHYYWLPSLRGQKKENGRREEMMLRLLEENEAEGGADFAAHT